MNGISARKLQLLKTLRKNNSAGFIFILSSLNSFGTEPGWFKTILVYIQVQCFRHKFHIKIMATNENEWCKENWTLENNFLWTKWRNYCFKLEFFQIVYSIIFTLNDAFLGKFSIKLTFAFFPHLFYHDIFVPT